MHDITLVYKSHKCIRNPDWHKIRAVVVFDITSSDASSVSEVFVNVDIDDHWFIGRDLLMPNDLPLDVLCEILFIAAPKIHAYQYVQNISTILVSCSDGKVTPFPSPFDCAIKMQSTAEGL